MTSINKVLINFILLLGSRSVLSITHSLALTFFSHTLHLWMFDCLQYVISIPQTFFIPAVLLWVQNLDRMRSIPLLYQDNKCLSILLFVCSRLLWSCSWVSSPFIHSRLVVNQSRPLFYWIKNVVHVSIALNVVFSLSLFPNINLIRLRYFHLNVPSSHHFHFAMHQNNNTLILISFNHPDYVIMNWNNLNFCIISIQHFCALYPTQDYFT